jgi:hypothetical protein
MIIIIQTFNAAASLIWESFVIFDAWASSSFSDIYQKFKNPKNILEFLFQQDFILSRLRAELFILKSEKWHCLIDSGTFLSI